MKNTLLTLSKPLPSKKEQLLSLLDATFRHLSVDYLLVGASARDILLEHVYGRACPRATMDIDLAISVQCWVDYQSVLNELEEGGYFQASTTMVHRLKSLQYGVIDLIPFGGIERDNKIAWPPDYSTKMNLLGFKDAARDAVVVKLASRSEIPVVSLAGLAALKIIAWKDRGYMSKDVSDFVFVLLNYIEAGNQARIESEFSYLLNDDFDFVTMNAMMLGNDLKRLVSKPCRQFLQQIFSDSLTDRDQRLINELATQLNGQVDPFAKASAMINELNNALIN